MEVNDKIDDGYMGAILIIYNSLQFMKNKTISLKYDSLKPIFFSFTQ